MRTGGFSFVGFLLARILRFASALAIGAVLFLVVVLFLLNHLIEAGEFRDLLIRELEGRTQLKVGVGAVEMDLGGITGIALKDFSLSDPLTARPILTAPKMVTRVALLPLWNWQIVVQDIRFDQPTLQVIRNQEGKVDLLEIFGRILFQKPDDFPFTLDLEEIRMEAAQVIFRDEFRRPHPLITELRQADLSLRRVARNGFLDVSTGRNEQNQLVNDEKPAVDYRLETVVEREGQHAEIASRGRITFEGDRFELRQARLEADFQAEKWPAGLLQEYYRDYLPWSAWSGMLNAHLRLQGNVAEGARLAGEVAFRDLRMELDQTLAGRVAPGNGRLAMEMEWQAQEVRLARLQLTSEEISFTAKGTVSFKQESDPYLNLQVSTPFLSITTARGYLPRSLLESPAWDSLVRSVDQGEVRFASLALNGRLAELRGLSSAGAESSLTFDAQVRGAAARPLSADYLPVRNVNGQLRWEKGILYFNDFAGTYGQSRLENVSGSREKTASGSELLEARIHGEADLGELYQQARSKLFPQAFVGTLAELRELNGKAAINLTLRADSESSPQVQGQIALVDTMLRTGAVVLKDIRGQLNISPSVIETEKIVATFAGSPVTLRGSIRDYAAATSSYDLTAESSGVSAGEISHLFFGSGSAQDPGTVRGWLRYRAVGAKSEDGNLSGVVELQGIQPPLEGFRQPPRQISGVVSFDGNRIDLQAIKGNIGNFGLEFSGQLRLGEKPSLNFTMTSPEMDIALLLPKGSSNAEWYDRFRAQGKIRIARGRIEGFHFSDLSTELIIERRLWRLENFSAASAGGKIEGRASFFDHPAPGVEYVIEPKIQGVAVQEFLGWFDNTTREITGAVNLVGKVESTGTSNAERRRNMNGQFQLEIQDGVLRRMPLLLRILNLMDLSRWFSFKLPDLNQQGIRFRKVTGDFKIVHGVYTTENLVVDSDDIGITGAGQYDGSNDTIDAVIALRPFPKIGSVVSYIPLVGPGIAGIQGSILVASFHVKGPVDDATITPAPLNTLSEFFFSALKIPQKMLTLPGSGTK
jgi:uncharacterized protein involved in outer membrane biogenesis